MRLLLPLLLLLSASNALAQGCLCASAPTAEQAFQASTVVFAGVVEKVEDPEADRIESLPANEQAAAREAAADTLSRIVTFRVMQWWKGDTKLREVKLYASSDGSACSMTTRVGESYLVYSKPSGKFPDKLTLSICSRTARLVCGRDDMKTLGKPLATFAEIDQKKLIAKEQPFPELGRGCMTLPLLINERPAVEERCYYDVDAVIDETGALRDFKDLTDRTKSGCVPLDAKLIATWRFRPATIDGTPVQTKLRRINRSEPFTVADDARWKARDAAREIAAKKN
jgi:hypothetical protein